MTKEVIRYEITSKTDSNKVFRLLMRHIGDRDTFLNMTEIGYMSITDYKIRISPDDTCVLEDATSDDVFYKNVFPSPTPEQIRGVIYPLVKGQVIETLRRWSRNTAGIKATEGKGVLFFPFVNDEIKLDEVVSTFIENLGFCAKEEAAAFAATFAKD